MTNSNDPNHPQDRAGGAAPENSATPAKGAEPNNRRAAFAQVAGAVRDLTREEVVEPGHPRPPGAVPEADFQLLCTGCGDCVTACPFGAIGQYPENSGVLSGTPAMNPNDAACHLCDGLPCAVACPEAALIPVPVTDVFLGLARILTDKCFVYKGPECGACAPACPPKSLRMVAGKPEITSDTCTGCGLCREACPVWDKAIAVDF